MEAHEKQGELQNNDEPLPHDLDMLAGEALGLTPEATEMVINEYNSLWSKT